MRRIELLINDIRFNVNQEDNNRFSDIRLNKFFNDAQKAIQSIIFGVDGDASVFDTIGYIDIVADQDSYDLPYDMYAVSSITTVAILYDNNGTRYSPISKVTNKEEGIGYGYYVSGNKLMFTMKPSQSVTNGIKISYVRKVPTLSIRIGQIASYVSGTSITLSAGFSTESILNFADFITVVDKDGVIKQRNIRMTNYSAGVISTPDLLTTIDANDYVVLGKFSTSHSELPEEAEPLLTAFVERKMLQSDSSPDIGDSNLFTDEEKQLIMNLFSKKDHDVKRPAILSGTYIN